MLIRLRMRNHSNASITAKQKNLAQLLVNPPAASMATPGGEDSRRQVSDRRLSEIAQENFDLEDLAPYLGLSDAEIVEVKRDNSSYRKQKTGLLKLWRERYGDRATYQCLIDAAMDSRNAKLASHIMDLLGGY